MKDFYSDFLKDDLWLIEETQWVRNLQNIRESQFTLGNGYLGIRGVLEEIPYDAMPGTYIAGIYDKIGSQVDELVNLPNPVNFKFYEARFPGSARFNASSCLSAASRSSSSSNNSVMMGGFTEWAGRRFSTSAIFSSSALSFFSNISISGYAFIVAPKTIYSVVFQK